MSRELDKKETYLYGTLIALIQDNLVALEKHRQGNLGFWGRSRASSRNSTIDKFVQKIIDHKAARGDADPIEEIVRDIAYIQLDSHVWDDVSDDALSMLRKLLTGT